MPVRKLVENRKQYADLEGARTHPSGVDSSWSASAVAIYVMECVKVRRFNVETKGGPVTMQVGTN